MLKKEIGIWGLGITGSTALKYLLKNNHKIGILEENPNIINANDILKGLSSKDKHKIQIFTTQEKKKFLNTYEQIIPSPGIDLRKYKNYGHKFISDIDIFQAKTKTPIIGVTGSLGKTSIVNLLTQILNQQNKKTQMAGNVGIGMLKQENLNKNLDFLVLELSSFQLNLTQNLTPQLSIITNIYPNHLDMHDNFESYLNAKLNILRNQSINQNALLNLDLYFQVQNKTNAKISFFSLLPPENPNPSYTYYYFNEAQEIILKQSGNQISKLLKLNATISYKLNLLIIIAALDILNQNLKINWKTLKIPAHRLHLFKTTNNIDIYDDSKSTVPEATLEAISNLKNRPIILLIGGTSKGINRENFIKTLSQKSFKQIIFFGVEAPILNTYAKKYNLNSYVFSELESATQKALEVSHPNDQILFSPAGASFDLFKNYEERGKSFQKIVNNLT